MLTDIQNMMAAKLRKDGIVSEITFIRDNMFSVMVDDFEQFERAKAIFAQVKTVRFDSEDCDPELGCIAYYFI